MMCSDLDIAASLPGPTRKESVDRRRQTGARNQQDAGYRWSPHEEDLAEMITLTLVPDSMKELLRRVDLDRLLRELQWKSLEPQATPTRHQAT
ncbi:MAG: hypothetical protein R2688_05610 [Fimbriimonadaceae bacterium]